MNKAPVLLCVLFLLSIISCQAAPNPTKNPTALPTRLPTSTPVVETSMVPPATATPSAVPTETPIPSTTAVPASATPEPFLPPNLSPLSLGNVINLQKLASIPVSGIYSLVFSTSGDKVATISERWQDRSKFLEVWDLQLGQQILFLDNLKNPWQTFFSVDENQLIVFYSNRNIEIYDLTQQKLIQTQEMTVDRIDYSPDRKYLAMAENLGIGDESVIKVVEVDSGDELFTQLNPGMVMYVEFSPDGKLLIAGIQRGNYFHDYVWEISTGELKADLIGYSFGLTFSPDNSLAAISKGTFVNLLSTGNWVVRYAFPFSDPYRNANPKSFTPDGNILVFEDRYNLVFMDISTAQEVLTLEHECDLRISPNGKNILTWCYQSELKIWGVVP